MTDLVEDILALTALSPWAMRFYCGAPLARRWPVKPLSASKSTYPPKYCFRTMTGIPQALK